MSVRPQPTLRYIVDENTIFFFVRCKFIRNALFTFMATHVRRTFYVLIVIFISIAYC